MKVTSKMLNKLRSGQQVWKVWFNYDLKEDRLVPNVYAQVALGRKILYRQKSAMDPKYDRQIPMFVCERFRRPYRDMVESKFDSKDIFWHYSVPFHYIHFLTDAAGTACYTSKRQADRFVQQVKDGLHPQIVERAKDNAEMDRMFDDMRWDDYETADYDTDEPDDATVIAVVDGPSSDETAADPAEGAGDTKFALPG